MPPQAEQLRSEETRRQPIRVSAPQDALQCLHRLLWANLHNLVNGILQSLVESVLLHIRLNGRTRGSASLLPLQLLLHEGLGVGGLHSGAGARRGGGCMGQAGRAPGSRPSQEGEGASHRGQWHALDEQRVSATYHLRELGEGRSAFA